MEQNWFCLIEQASEISKITLSVIVYAPCLNKTTIKSNKKTDEQISWHFFLNDPLFLFERRQWLTLASIRYFQFLTNVSFLTSGSDICACNVCNKGSKCLELEPGVFECKCKAGFSGSECEGKLFSYVVAVLLLCCIELNSTFSPK